MPPLSLPPPTQRLTNRDNRVTEPWYPVFAEIQRLRAELDDLKRLLRNDGALDVSATGTATFVGSA